MPVPGAAPPLERPRESRAFGPFQLRALVAQGRRTTTWIAERGPKELFALREIAEHLPIEAVDQEARLARAVLVGEPLLPLAHAGKRAALVTSLVVGESLATILAHSLQHQRPLDLTVALGIARGIAEQLQVLGDQRVHGDLVPQHVLVGYDGGVRLLDPAPESALNRLLDPNRAGYHSPEHTRGGPITPASDVFSLGILLWEMSTGLRLYGAPTARENDPRILEGHMPRPRDLFGDGYPIEVQLVLRKLLRANASGRFADAKSARDALRLASANRIDATPAIARWMQETHAERWARWREHVGIVAPQTEATTVSPPKSRIVTLEAIEEGDREPERRRRLGLAATISPAFVPDLPTEVTSRVEAPVRPKTPLPLVEPPGPDASTALDELEIEPLLDASHSVAPSAQRPEDDPWVDPAPEAFDFNDQIHTARAQIGPITENKAHRVPEELRRGRGDRRPTDLSSDLLLPPQQSRPARSESPLAADLLEDTLDDDTAAEFLTEDELKLVRNASALPGTIPDARRLAEGGQDPWREASELHAQVPPPAPEPQFTPPQPPAPIPPPTPPAPAPPSLPTAKPSGNYSEIRSSREPATDNIAKRPPIAATGAVPADFVQADIPTQVVRERGRHAAERAPTAPLKPSVSAEIPADEISAGSLVVPLSDAELTPGRGRWWLGLLIGLGLVGSAALLWSTLRSLQEQVTLVPVTSPPEVVPTATLSEARPPPTATVSVTRQPPEVAPVFGQERALSAPPPEPPVTRAPPRKAREVAEPGRVRVRIQPAQATLLVNGAEMENGAWIELQPGGVSVTISAPGYRTQTIQLGPETKRELLVLLQKE